MICKLRKQALLCRTAQFINLFRFSSSFETMSPFTPHHAKGRSMHGAGRHLDSKVVTL